MCSYYDVAMMTVLLFMYCRKSYTVPLILIVDDQKAIIVNISYFAYLYE